MVQHKTLDVITLFHRPSTPASVRVHTILKQASANITETATIDPAAKHSQQNKAQRNEFELDVVEDPPTSDQLRSMLEYIGGKKASDLVNGARDEADAMRKLRDSGESFVRPVVRHLLHSVGEVATSSELADRAVDRRLE